MTGSVLQRAVVDIWGGDEGISDEQLASLGAQRVLGMKYQKGW